MCLLMFQGVDSDGLEASAPADSAVDQQVAGSWALVGRGQ